MSSMPTRIEADLYDAAVSAGAVMRRSAAQQLNYWARLGREFESAHGVSQRDIAAVLSGRSSYDALGALEQAVVRAEWDEQMAEARTSLNFAEEFEAAGDSWVEADAGGRTVVRRSRRQPEKQVPAKKAVARKRSVPAGREPAALQSKSRTKAPAKAAARVSKTG